MRTSSCALLIRWLQEPRLALLQCRHTVTAFCCYCHWHFSHYARDLEDRESRCYEFEEQLRRVGGTHYALDHFGWWPTFLAANSLLAASLVISRHSDIFSAGLLVTLQIPSPLLFAEDGKALSKGSLDKMQRQHIASRIFVFSRTGKLPQMQYRHIALFAEGEMVAQATFTSPFAYS